MVVRNIIVTFSNIVGSPTNVFGFYILSCHNKSVGFRRVYFLPWKYIRQCLRQPNNDFLHFLVFLKHTSPPSKYLYSVLYVLPTPHLSIINVFTSCEVILIDFILLSCFRLHSSFTTDPRFLYAFPVYFILPIETPYLTHENKNKSRISCVERLCVILKFLFGPYFLCTSERLCFPIG